MTGFWNLLAGLGRWYGLLVIALAILGGLINGSRWTQAYADNDIWYTQHEMAADPTWRLYP